MTFRAMLLGGSLLLHAYVFWRAATVPAVARRIGPWAMAALGLAAWGGSAAARSLAHDAAGPAAAVVELLSMDWLATLFLVATVLLAVDIVTLFGLLLRRRAPTLRGWALLAGSGLALAAVVQGTRAPVVTEHEVALPGLPEAANGTVLVAISDLHVGTLLGPRWLAARVAQVNALAPDVIVLLGDVIEGHGIHAEEVVPLLRRLSARLGVLAVTGNHDSYGVGGARWLAAAGLEVLRDRCIALRPGLAVAGIDARSLRRADGAGALLDGMLASCPPGGSILLSHYPTVAASAADSGFGLLLSGHTHGGQVWPFSYLVATRYPLLAGQYLVNGMPVIVSRGTGTWGPRMRLWRPGEVLRLTLRSAR